MPSDKPALLKESVSIRKSNEAVVLKGEFALYDDRVVLKISHGFALSELMRPLPPTFPDVDIKETIQFSRIKGIGGGLKKGVLSRSARIELQTDEGVTWSIKGPSIIFDALQNSYQTWKRSGHQ